MVRVARNSSASMLPPGYSHLTEVPSDLFLAIQHANGILNWFENLSRDEQPPEWMWPFADEIEKWFREVELARKEKYGGGGSHQDYDWDNSGAMENTWRPGDDY